MPSELLEFWSEAGVTGCFIILCIWAVVYYVKSIAPRLNNIESKIEILTESSRQSNEIISKSNEIMADSKEAIESSRDVIQNNTQAIDKFSDTIRELIIFLNSQSTRWENIEDGSKDIQKTVLETQRDVMILLERDKK